MRYSIIIAYDMLMLLSLLLFIIDCSIELKSEANEDETKTRKKGAIIN